MLEVNKIYNMDCLEGMKLIADNSIDLIITSPPYNLGKDHHTGSKRTNTYFDNMPENEYQQWQIEVLSECYRVLKIGGSMFYNHKNRIRNHIQISPYEWIYKSPFTIKQEIVWFNRSQNFDKCRFYPMTERVYWLSKGNKTQFYNTINHHDVFDTKDWPAVGTKGEFKRAFPLKMAEDLMNCFPCFITVLDPFMGSGTVALAAKNTKRKYIGFEIEPQYCDLAEKRLSNEASA